LGGPVAIVGYAGRFPGARSVDEFWENLVAGRDCVCQLSDEELAEAGVNPEQIEDPYYVKAAAPIADPDRFDAGFFEFSPKEAVLLDPQQRLFLECAWEALEHSGHAAANPHLRIGVYGGSAANVSSYALAYSEHFSQGLGQSGGLYNLASDKDYLSTRVSYKLGLRGPSVNVQTACSTSLTAIHLACRSLLSGECDMALAGGVSVRVPLRSGYQHVPGGIVSSDGRCRVFDASADGTMFGSGVGIVVLKKLADAQADRNRIYALIRGSALNNDGGRKASYASPSVEGQVDAIRSALDASGIAPRSINYIEMHGTGTPVGDPVEVAAFREALQDDGTEVEPCYVGSAKASIGHLDAASGVAGLLKAMCVVRHKVVPPIPHLHKLNPNINLEGSRLAFPTSPVEWRRPGVMRACVNSLGIGGTNAHVVVEGWEEEPKEKKSGDGSDLVLVLSARTEEALKEQARQYAQYLETSSETKEDIAYTAAVGRVSFEERLVIGAGDWSGKLKEYVEGTSSRGWWRGQGRERKKIAFLYSGQGAQYAGMGRELYREEAVFRAEIERLSRVVESAWGRGELERLIEAGSEEELRETKRTQAVVYAVECGLTRLWAEWGVEPDVVLGHSVGEYAAAQAAGVYGAEEGMRLIAWRGERMGQLAAGGAMAALLCREPRVREWLEAGVEIASENGPENTVVSGEAAAVERVLARAERAGVMGQPLRVSHAFHSARMEPMLEEWRRYASQYGGRATKAVWISTLTGERVEAVDGDYWRNQVRERVRYRAAVERALEEGCEVLLEVGPGSTLVGLGKRCPGGEGVQWLTSLERGKSERLQMAEAAGQLWAAGVVVKWESFYRDRKLRRVALPTYPFQRQRHWLEHKAGAQPSSQKSQFPGRRISSPLLTSKIFEQRLAAAPADPAAHLNQITRALDKELNGSIHLNHVYVDRSRLPSGPLVAQTIITPQAQGVYGLEWFVRPERIDDQWMRIAQATLCNLPARADAVTSGSILYESAWRPQARGTASVRPAVWCLIAEENDSGLEMHLAAALGNGGVSVWIIRSASCWVQRGKNIGLRFDRAEDWERLVKILPEGLIGAAYLCTAPEVDGVAGSIIVDYQFRTNQGLLLLAQSLMRRSNPSKIQIVTTSASLLPGDEALPAAKWTSVGFGRVLAQEHPELGGNRIDISDATSAHDLAEELQSSLNSRETEVALRASGRFVRRLITARAPSNHRVALRSDAAYVVAGSSGGLGRETALWLAQKGASHLLLLQRSAPDMEFIARLNSMGAKATVERLDITDGVRVNAVFEHWRNEGICIRGLVHAAGVMEQGIIDSVDMAQLERVFAGRVSGAWNLHFATASLPLDFFVLYSSLSATLGIVGLSTYASSHTFLDGLAEFRRSRGLPGLSVQWSAWDDIGLGKLIGIRDNDQFRSHGGQHLDRAEAFEMLDRLLVSSPPVASVFRMDWEKLVAQYPIGAVPLLLEELVPARISSPAQRMPVNGNSAPDRDSSRDTVLYHLRDVLQLSEKEPVPMHRPLKELGLDSMLAIELRNCLGKAFHRQLPATVLFNYPTAHELIGYLSGTMIQAGTATQRNGSHKKAVAPSRALADSIDDLTADEAEERLALKVAQLAAREWR
jgi:acyl transferase domain-containing protein